MHCLLTHVNWRPTKTGALFTWEGAWKYDPVRGTGSVKLGKGGRLRGRIHGIQEADGSIPLCSTYLGSTIPSPISHVTASHTASKEV
jgi:hypothetical protein